MNKTDAERRPSLFVLWPHFQVISPDVDQAEPVQGQSPKVTSQLGVRPSSGLLLRCNLKLLSTNISQTGFNRLIFPSQLLACKEHHPQRHEIQQYPLVVVSSDCSVLNLGHF